MYVVVVLGRVLVALGGRAGEKLPDVARIHTRPKKLKYFSILSLNQTIKQSDNQNGVLQTSWIHDRGRDEETR